MPEGGREPEGEADESVSGCASAEHDFYRYVAYVQPGRMGDMSSVRQHH